jgi:hypothetical protein
LISREFEEFVYLQFSGNDMVDQSIVDTFYEDGDDAFYTKNDPLAIRFSGNGKFDHDYIGKGWIILHCTGK